MFIMSCTFHESSLTNLDLRQLQDEDLPRCLDKLLHLLSIRLNFFMLVLVEGCLVLGKKRDKERVDYRKPVNELRRLKNSQSELR